MTGLGAITDQIADTAARYGVPPSLAVAVAQRESGFNQSARGTSGEIGVFQLMPGTASDLGVNPSELAQNIDGGVRYLAQLFVKFGDWGTALMAYNGGPGNVERGTVSSAAKSYSAAVLAASGVETPAGFEGSYPEVDFAEPGAGLSPLLMVGLGVAGVALLAWLVLD